MTAIQNRTYYSYAPAARYQAQNMYVSQPRQQAPSAPIFRTAHTQPARPAPWGRAPYTPLQDVSAGYLHRPTLRTSIPMPVVALLSTVIVIIAVAVAWSLN